ncbi:hypothetical protein C5167_012861 [Papaver somniferum]|uniref:Uncharacterized protein n=1 Tax=Papaver somniferum TaxID=3469 RepID=A0A4Y7J1R5_PAPSO|nr:hypothetical protein C5167_012861 [Papaver somniferum]
MQFSKGSDMIHMQFSKGSDTIHTLLVNPNPNVLDFIFQIMWSCEYVGYLKNIFASKMLGA